MGTQGALPRLLLTMPGTVGTSWFDQSAEGPA
jgi:hypothetical protein